MNESYYICGICGSKIPKTPRGSLLRHINEHDKNNKIKGIQMKAETGMKTSLEDIGIISNKKYTGIYVAIRYGDHPDAVKNYGVSFNLRRKYDHKDTAMVLGFLVGMVEKMQGVEHETNKK